MLRQATYLSRPTATRFWSAWLLALGLTVSLTVAAALTAYLPGDVEIAGAVQQHSPPLLPSLLHALNVIGTGWPAAALVLVAVAGLVGMGRSRLALLLAAVNALQPLDTLLKQITDRPRPSPALVRVTEHASGMSFPSGHVFGAMLLYGTLAVLLACTPLLGLARWLLQAVCIAVVVLMGVARVYVGAHWPSDVVGGWLWGGLIVAVVARAAARAPDLSGGQCAFVAGP